MPCRFDLYQYSLRLFLGLIILFSLFSSTATVYAGCSSPTFNATTNYPLSSGARSLALGDFDGDGNLDVVLAHHVANYISISLNDGNGGYSVPNYYPVKSQPYFIVTGDFNEDGKLDIATVGYDNNTGATSGFVSILLGDGKGGFGALTSYPVGSSPQFMAVGDFNKDNHLDLVIANSGSSNISVLLGDGKGNFGAAVNYAVTSFPRTVAIGDFNKDGNPDLIIGHYSHNSISLLLGTGTGSFSSPTSISVGSTSSSDDNVAVGDFNGDGNPDVAVGITDPFPRGVSILLGNGAGGFASPIFTAVEFPGYLVVGDLNGDGKQDILVANGGNSTDAVSVLFGNGSGGFSLTSLVVGYGPTWAAIADLNKDGKADLVVTNPGSSDFSVLFADGTGKFGTTNYPEGSPGGTQATYAVTGDFNGDGKPDVAVANNFSNDVSVLIGDGAGSLGAPATFAVGFRPDSIVTGDFNGDGNLDLATGNGSNGFGFSTVSILLGDGKGSFSASTSYSLGNQSLTKSIATGDLNADGKLDIVTANQASGTVTILMGNGAGGFGSPTNITVGSSAYFVALSDLNGDGKLDIVVSTGNSSNSSGYITVLLGDGTGGFGTATNLGVGFYIPSFIAVADFNGDGKNDLAFTTINSTFSILLGNGTGGFGTATSFGTIPATSLVVKDFNGDGNLDIAASSIGAGHSISLVLVFLGDGTGKLRAGKTYVPGQTPLSIVADDFNRDGNVDLAVANYDSASVSVLLNDCHAMTSQPPSMTVNNAIVTEGITGTRPAVFTITLTQPSTDPVTVDYTTLGDSAESGTDFQPVQGQLTFAPGETTKAINVLVNGDNMWEPDEYFFLKLSNPVNATIKRQQGLGTILNDDPIPKITINDTGVTEGNSGTTQMNFIITLTNPTSQQVSMDYTTADGTASQNIDYSSVSGHLIITPGNTSYTISVPVYGDTLDEINETFTMNLSNATGATFTKAQAIGTIFDDDPPPGIRINDVSIAEGNSGTTNLTFSVLLSAPSAKLITVNYSTSDGTATAGSDYQQASGTLTFNPGETTKTITVLVNADTVNEPDETFFINLTAPMNATISRGQAVGTILNDDAPTVQFSAPSYTVGEGDGRATITVTRTDSTSAASVNYATSDTLPISNTCQDKLGIASARCDYATTIGTLQFAVGESSKTISIPIVDDAIVEGPETFSLTVSNPVGAVLGSLSSATITITDNDNVAGANPVDDASFSFFVRQHYIDFLGREPDAAGATWQDILSNCGTKYAQPCDRIEVSGDFFRSEEFQTRGYFIYRFYKTLPSVSDSNNPQNGHLPHYNEFMPDLARVSGALTPDQLEANKVAFINDFMARSEYQTTYASINDPTSYVNVLLLTVGLPNHPTRQTWIDSLTNGSMTKAQVLRALIESSEMYQKYYNEAFVIMQYFGYLRRDADLSYQQWLQTMKSTNGDYRTMINGFLNSTEYRQRFGP
jgi:hypothetical protein